MPSTSAASCEADNRITPSLIGGQRKARCSSRFQNNTSPDPSQAGADRFRKIFKRTVKACLQAKIATGEIVHVDASLTGRRFTLRSPLAVLVQIVGVLQRPAERRKQ
jgi:hypothetical protein